MDPLERHSLQRGMVVRSPEGRRLGTVYLLGATSFELRRGLTRPHLWVRYGDVSSLAGGEIHLRVGWELLGEGAVASAAAGEPPSTIKPLGARAQLSVEERPLDRWESSRQPS